MTIRMSSAMLGPSSLDSPGSFVEIDSDNTTSRSSSHDALDDDDNETATHISSSVPIGRSAPAATNQSDDEAATAAQHGANHCSADSGDDVIDTKPNVSVFMAQSEHFLKNNFAAMGGHGLGGPPHHHHHHSHPGLSAALHGYHQQHQHHHMTPSSPDSAGTSTGIGSSSGAVSRVVGGPFNGGAHHHHHHGNPHHSHTVSTAKPPFMQLYKSLFANAVLQNPDKMSSAGFARNLLFSCGGGGVTDRSPPESDGEVDDKGSLVEEVGIIQI